MIISHSAWSLAISLSHPSHAVSHHSSHLTEGAEATCIPSQPRHMVLYTENKLSWFPPYDCEPMSHVDLTLENITHGYFSQSVLQELRPLSAQEVASNHLEMELIMYERLKQQTLSGHKASAGVLPKGWKASWYQLQTTLPHSSPS